MKWDDRLPQHCPETGHVDDPMVCVDCEAVRLSVPRSRCRDCERARQRVDVPTDSVDPWAAS